MTNRLSDKRRLDICLPFVYSLKCKYPLGVYEWREYSMAKECEKFEMEDIVKENQEKRTCCCGAGIHAHKMRTEQEQKALITRLKKVEGQIRGIERMVEENAYCPDILIQVSAATSALNSFNKTLLACHIRGCVAEDIREGNDETIDELCAVLQRLMR